MANEVERLQAENAQLRQQLDDHRLRELKELRQQLAEARADVTHYRNEAQRNADLGRQIAAEAQAEFTRLRERVQALEKLPNARLAKPA